MHDTLTVNQLCSCLKKMDRKYGKGDGKMIVMLSGDEEGNYYGTISSESFGADDNGIIVIYPWKEYIDI